MGLNYPADCERDAFSNLDALRNAILRGLRAEDELCTLLATCNAEYKRAATENKGE